MAITEVLRSEVRIPCAVSGWKFVHFNIKVSTRDALRLSSCDGGFRDACKGFSGIGICLQVPPNISDRAKIEMAVKTAKMSYKSSLSAAGQVMASNKSDAR